MHKSIRESLHVDLGPELGVLTQLQLGFQLLYLLLLLLHKRFQGPLRLLKVMHLIFSKEDLVNCTIWYDFGTFLKYKMVSMKLKD